MPMLEGYKTFGLTKVILLSLLYFFLFATLLMKCANVLRGVAWEAP